MRKLRVCLYFIAVVYSVIPAAASSQIGRIANGAPKYVFFFLADGAGMTHLEIARQYRQYIHNEGMVIVDKIIKEGSIGVITTHPANSLSTDSAAAATAMASGCKARIGALGVCADGTPAVSAMEIARQRGMKLGLATNSQIYDASPAAFVCHVSNRKDYPAILRRYQEMAPDVLLGGGMDQFLLRGQPGSQRTDDSDPIAEFAKLGYQTVSNLTQLQRASGNKVLGLFGLSEMSFEIDRDKQTEPSVYDLTQAAIRLLQGPRGFFAFIESENIDRASHASDITSVIHDYREFDRAVGLAYDFYRKYPRDTLIIVASDHESGGLGMTLALKDMSSSKGSNMVDGKLDDFKKLQRINLSLQKAANLLGANPKSEAVDKLMAEHFPGFSMAPEFKEKILNGQFMSRTIFAEPVANALGMMVANNTQIYWQNTAHSNHPVLVAALGVGAERFKGYYDNADFGKKLKALIDGKKHP